MQKYVNTNTEFKIKHQHLTSTILTQQTLKLIQQRNQQQTLTNTKSRK